MNEDLNELLHEINSFRNSTDYGLPTDDAKVALMLFDRAIVTNSPDDIREAFEEVNDLADYNPYKEKLTNALNALMRSLDKSNTNSEPIVSSENVNSANINPEPIISSVDFDNTNINPEAFTNFSGFSDFTVGDYTATVDDNMPELQALTTTTINMNKVFDPKPIELARALETLKKLCADHSLTMPNNTIASLNNALITGKITDISHTLIEAAKLKDDDVFKAPLLAALDSMNKIVERHNAFVERYGNQPFSPRGEYKTAIVSKAPVKEPVPPAQPAVQEEEVINKNQKKPSIIKQQLLNLKNALISKKNKVPPMTPEELITAYEYYKELSGDENFTIDDLIAQASGIPEDEETMSRSRGYSLLFLLGLLSSIVTIGIIVASYFYFL